MTVKIRSGWSRSSINAVEIARIAEDSGADAITVHARTADQGFSGHADWKVIAQVKKAVKIPVIGNGDIWQPRGCGKNAHGNILRCGDGRQRSIRQSLDI